MFAFLVVALWIMLSSTLKSRGLSLELHVIPPSPGSIFKHDHSAVRSLAVKLYREGIELLKSKAAPDMTTAISCLERSYVLVSTVEAAEGLGDIYSSLGDYSSSTTWYQLAFRAKGATNDVSLALKLGFDYHKNAQFLNAISVYQQGISSQIQSINERVNDVDYSRKIFFLSALYYHTGLSYSHNGDPFTAAQHFNNAISYNDDNINARINLAAVFQKHGEIDQAVSHYDHVIKSVHKNFDPFVSLIDDSFIMCVSNKIMAFYQLSNFEMAWKSFEEIFVPVSFHFSACKGGGVVINSSSLNLDPSSAYCKSIIATYYQLISHSLVVSIASLNWKTLEYHSALLLHKFQVDHSLILPFDSLLYQYSLKDRLRIAIEYTNRRVSYNLNDGVYYYTPKELESSLFVVPAVNSSTNRRPMLRIGLISNDFSDHPTTHLIEGLLVAKRESENEFVIATPPDTSTHRDGSSNFVNDDNVLRQVEINLYNYGNNDGSVYRRNMESLADKFVDLEQSSYSDIAGTIHKDNIHILLDMQVHTLGCRLDVMAKQPAVLQLNYLVYPGTSGSPFLGAIVVDRVVVPPEHARLYSESLVMLPPSYQLSYYDRHISTTTDNYLSINGRYLDKSRGQTIVDDIIHKTDIINTIADALKVIPEDAILFCNFNKIDKIEPITIHIWMNILVQFPSSYLFLLAPLNILDNAKNNKNSSNFDVFGSIQNSFRQFASYHGVKPSRILFVKKVNKTEHIQRHSVMDLFIDSFGYGAHSTATDALRNGIPLFTMEGDAFPGRVASSLIESFTTSANEVLPNNSSSSRSSGSSGGGDDISKSILVHNSCKDFEDYTSRICRFRKVGVRNALLSLVRGRIVSKIERKIGIFSTKTNAKKLLYGLEALLEGKLLKSDEASLNKYFHFNKQSKVNQAWYFNETSVNGFHVIVK